MKVFQTQYSLHHLLILLILAFTLTLALPTTSTSISTSTPTIPAPRSEFLGTSPTGPLTILVLRIYNKLNTIYAATSAQIQKSKGLYLNSSVLGGEDTDKNVTCGSPVALELQYPIHADDGAKAQVTEKEETCAHQPIPSPQPKPITLNLHHFLLEQIHTIKSRLYLKPSTHSAITNTKANTKTSAHSQNTPTENDGHGELGPALLSIWDRVRGGGGGGPGREMKKKKKD